MNAIEHAEGAIRGTPQEGAALSTGLPERRDALPAEASAAPTLDERIRRAEQHLIGREHRVQRQFDALGNRVREAVQPRRLTHAALGVVGAVVALGFAGAAAQSLLRGKRSPASAPAPDVPAPPSGVPQWVLQLVPLAWPLLPARLRERVSPATAASMVAIGLPALSALVGRHGNGALPPPATAAHVDLTRYSGTWYELARLPDPFERVCDGQPSATYTLRGGAVEVENRCRGRDGAMRSARGMARVVPGSGGAKLEVSLFPCALRWLPVAWADYWILHVDPEYRVAVVGSPRRTGLWLLSRSPQVPQPQLQALIGIARQQGFAVDKLKIVAP